MAKKRSFTILSSCINVQGGKYKSTNTASAAKKAANMLFKKAKSMAKYKSIRRITFTLRETTSGSNKDEFKYKASRIKLSQPVVRIINGKQVVNKFKTHVSAIPDKLLKRSMAIKCNRT